MTARLRLNSFSLKTARSPWVVLFTACSCRAAAAAMWSQRPARHVTRSSAQVSSMCLHTSVFIIRPTVFIKSFLLSRNPLLVFAKQMNSTDKNTNFNKLLLCVCVSECVTNTTCCVSEVTLHNTKSHTNQREGSAVHQLPLLCEVKPVFL